MAEFVVETTFDVYSPKDWMFPVQTTIKFEVEATMEVFSPEEWKLKL